MVTALQLGVCVVCLEWYGQGEELGLMPDGWAHLDCWTWTMEEIA